MAVQILTGFAGLVTRGLSPAKVIASAAQIVRRLPVGFSPGTAIFNRFPTLSGTMRLRILKAARAVIETSAAIDTSPLDLEIGLDDIPILPQLFGDDPLGRRFQVITRTEFSDTGAFRTHIMDFEGVTTLQELEDAVRERLREHSFKCDPPTELDIDNIPSEDIQILQILRRS